MRKMFLRCESLVSFKNISEHIFRPNNLSDLINKCKSLISITDMSKWDVSEVTNMKSMFSDCNSLKSLPDISKWNLSNVKDMSCIFFLIASL